MATTEDITSKSTAVLEKALNGHCPHYGAIFFVKIARQLVREGRQDMAESLLGLHWLQVSHYLLKKTNIREHPPALAASCMVLERYFGMRGDWHKMASSMEADVLDSHPDINLVEMQATIERAAKEFARSVSGPLN